MFQKAFFFLSFFRFAATASLCTFKVWNGGGKEGERLLCMFSQQTVAKRGSHGSRPDMVFRYRVLFFFPPFHHSLQQLVGSNIEFARFGELRSMWEKKNEYKEALVSHCARKRYVVCWSDIFTVVAKGSMTAHHKSGPKYIELLFSKGQKTPFPPFIFYPSKQLLLLLPPLFFLRAKMTKKTAHGRKSYGRFEQ